MRAERTSFIAALLLASAPLQAGVTQGDPVLEALEPELKRNLKSLTLPEQPRPYYLGFSHLSYQIFNVTARLGDVVQAQFTRSRYVHARMRVGNRERDNTNFYGYGGGSRGTARLTTDGRGPGGQDDPRLVVRDAWLAADAAYKRVLEALAAKEAALKREQQSDRAPDFSPAVSHAHWERPVELDEGERKTLRKLIGSVSAVFRAFPAIQRGTVRGNARANTIRFIDSDGFKYRQAHTAVRVTLTAQAQAVDGTPLTDVVSIMAPSVAQLPSAAALADRARAMASRLVRRITAENLEGPYLGPVLFTPQAAAEFIRQTLAGDLAGTPSPVVAADYMKSRVRGGQLARFLGLRVLPEWMTVTSDPGRDQWNGRPLLGHYTVDWEGVPGKPVELVTDGRLRGFLMSRTPSKKFTTSNGHGRIVAGPMARAVPANLILEARKSVPERILIKRLRKLAKKDGLEYAMIVRHLGGGSGRRISLGTGGEDVEDAPSRWAISPALDVARVDVKTGKETPVRGALFGPIGVAELRNIVAATRESAVYSFFINPERIDSAQGYTQGTTASIVAPGLLFSQLEVRPMGKKHKPLPLLPHPLFAKPPL